MLGSIKVLYWGQTCVDEIRVFLAYIICLLHVDGKSYFLHLKSVLPMLSLSERVRDHMMPLI